jgi:exopolyphosphatase / guanosine-5'-triphosphate,3'-diphosphate pyrophosphatase
MKTAIIDCGTNTFHLLVAEYDATGHYTMLENEKRNVKLGEGRILERMIAPLPFERGLRAFHELVQLAKSHGVETISAYATAAIRSAINGADFVSQVKEKTGITIEVIDGEREALLIYKGVRLALGNLPGTTLIMDIGGGSTEFILAQGQEIIWKRSFELGVSRLLQQFQPADPIRPEDITALEKYFAQRLEPLAWQVSHHPPALLVGCSGSFESLASMILAQRYGTAFDDKSKTYHFKEADYQRLHQALLASGEESRYKMPGLVAVRVDTIVYASVFINFVKRHFNIPEMLFSNYALKEGAFSEILVGRR